MKQSTVPAALAAVLLLAACAPDDEPPEGAAETPVTDDTAGELAEAEQEIERLRVENEELRHQLAAAETVPDPESPEDPDMRLVSVPEPPHTSGGLVEQLHAYFIEITELPEGFEPGVTDWRDADVPDGFDAGAGFESPGQLVTALAAQIAGDGLGGPEGTWEVAARVHGEDTGEEASGAVLLWGFADDSVAGSDLLLELERTDEGWHAVAAQERFHCRRGVSEEEGLCV